MTISRDELVDAVSICIARYRINPPARDYDKDDARVEHAFGWVIEHYPKKVILA